MKSSEEKGENSGSKINDYKIIPLPRKEEESLSQKMDRVIDSVNKFERYEIDGRDKVKIGNK